MQGGMPPAWEDAMIQFDKDYIESVTKTVVALAGLATAVYQGYYRFVRGFRTRAAIRRDLEMLKLFDASDPSHQIIRDHIHRTVLHYYGPPSPPFYRRLPSPSQVRSYWSRVRAFFASQLARIPRPKGVGEFCFGLILFLLFALWTSALNEGGFSWWSLLTGFFALMGIGGIVSSFDPRRDRGDSPSGPPSPPSPPPAASPKNYEGEIRCREIRCQFIILARKDEPTPDYPHGCCWGGGVKIWCKATGFKMVSRGYWARKLASCMRSSRSLSQVTR